MRFIYSLFVWLYTFGIVLLAPFNPKAKLWAKGRKEWKKKLTEIDFVGHEIFWFHCASLGEFEQGRPLIEAIKSQGKYKIVLTFFSPSGYELQKNYPLADWVFYLPADTMSNAHFFINSIQPKAVFFIKYEFWFNYLFVLKRNKIPVFLISGIFREQQHFFKWYGAWASKQLNAFNYFFVQNQKSLELLNNIGYKNVLVTGDTRFDRVIQIMQKSVRHDIIELFVKDFDVIVAGSTYFDDEKLLKNCYNNLIKERKNLKIVIAPHQISQNRINEIESLFGIENCIRFSQIKSQELQKSVLIIDNIGMLSSLYHYATVAYIGGGFGKGIHNTLEAAVYGIPLVYGSNYHKFDEAKALINCGAAFEITNEASLNEILQKLFIDEVYRKDCGLKASQYIADHKGSLEKIMMALKSKNILN